MKRIYKDRCYIVRETVQVPRGGFKSERVVYFGAFRNRFHRWNVEEEFAGQRGIYLLRNGRLPEYWPRLTGPETVAALSTGKYGDGAVIVEAEAREE